MPSYFRQSGIYRGRKEVPTEIRPSANQSRKPPNVQGQRPARSRHPQDLPEIGRTPDQGPDSLGRQAGGARAKHECCFSPRTAFCADIVGESPLAPWSTGFYAPATAHPCEAELSTSLVFLLRLQIISISAFLLWLPKEENRRPLHEFQIAENILDHAGNAFFFTERQTGE